MQLLLLGSLSSKKGGDNFDKIQKFKNVRIQRKISNYERIKEHLKFFFCIHIPRNVEDAKDYHVAQVTAQVTSTYVETPTSKHMPYT